MAPEHSGRTSRANAEIRALMATFLDRDASDAAAALGLSEARVRSHRHAACRTLAWSMRPFDRRALRELWMSVLKLTPLRPAVFMLWARDGKNLSLLSLVIRDSIESRDEAARKLRLPKEEMNELWRELPLSFDRISRLLRRTPQEVTRLYMEARTQLGDRLRQFELRPDSP